MHIIFTNNKFDNAKVVVNEYFDFSGKINA